MDVMNAVVEKTKAIAGMVGKKAGEALDISKLKWTRCRMKNRIDKSFIRLGKVVYYGRKNGKNVRPVVEQCVEELDEKLTALDKMDVKIRICQNLARNKRVCTHCGCALANDQVYCPQCGTKSVSPVIGELKDEFEEEMDTFSAPLENIFDDLDR